MSAIVAAPQAGARTIALPPPRGRLSERLFAALRARPDSEIEIGAAELDAVGDPLGDDDLQLALYLAYELHYASVEGVEEQWEWAPSLLSFTAQLERRFEEALRQLVPLCEREEAEDVSGALRRIVAQQDGPSLSRFLERQGTREQMLEHIVHRSAYQLKEADPHSFAIPRLAGAPKAALLEIQFDEYGSGRAQRMHSQLFAKTMSSVGLDPSYGAYLHLLPGVTLATVNRLSGFGLHRRRRGALVGHLAVFEMTSSIPNRRYRNALRRLGYGAESTDFYDEHVEADAVHECIAASDLAGGLAQAEPHLASDILFGARALLALEARWAQWLLHRWREGRSSLLASQEAKLSTRWRINPSRPPSAKTAR